MSSCNIPVLQEVDVKGSVRQYGDTCRESQFEWASALGLVDAR